MESTDNKYKRYRDRHDKAGGRQISARLPPEYRKKFDKLKAEASLKTDIAVILKLIDGHNL